MGTYIEKRWASSEHLILGLNVRTEMPWSAPSMSSSVKFEHPKESRVAKTQFSPAETVHSKQDELNV